MDTTLKPTTFIKVKLMEGDSQYDQLWRQYQKSLSQSESSKAILDQLTTDCNALASEKDD